MKNIFLLAIIFVFISFSCIVLLLIIPFEKWPILPTGCIGVKVFGFEDIPLFCLGGRGLTISDRIGFSQLILELVGSLAILLAAYEFHKSQRKPKLELFLSPQSDQAFGTPSKNIEFFINSFTKFGMTFKVLLGNFFLIS